MALTVNYQQQRVRALWRDSERESAYAPGGELWYQFRVAPSCPPDKRLHIRGGIVANVETLQPSIPDVICDFENVDETQMSLSFSNSGYYLPIILCYSTDWLWYEDEPGEDMFNNVIGIEVQTSNEAEAQIDGFLNGVEQWKSPRMPLSGVIFKNNGTTDIPVAIEEIDAVNRGRSYIYRDARSHGGNFS